MEIRVFDSDFNLKNIIENHSSLLWRRKYNDVGEFTLTCPASTVNVEALEMGRIVWVKGKREAGVVESRVITQSQKENSLVVSGRFLESYMDRRLIRPTFDFEGYVEVAMRTILDDAVALPMVELGTLQGFTEEVTFQATYKNLLDYEKRLAKSAAFGFRFVPDFVNKTITFEVYKGEDHTISQNDRARVIFSEGYSNMTSSQFSENDSLYKTVAYVGGEGEWRDKQIVVSGDDTLTGLERREVYVDGSDLTSNGLTIAQYKAALAQRGVESLESCVNASAFTCEIDPMGNFVYGEHYDVGDIVTVYKESWGVSEDLRITEIEEIYEKGLPTIQPTLGTPLPETINWEE